MHRDLFIPSKSSSYVAATTLASSRCSYASARASVNARAIENPPWILPSPYSTLSPAAAVPAAASSPPTRSRHVLPGKSTMEVPLSAGGGEAPLPALWARGRFGSQFIPAWPGWARDWDRCGGGRGTGARGGGEGRGRGAASSSPTLTPSIHGGRPSATVGAGRAPGGRAGLAGLEGAAGRRIGHGLCIVYNIYGDAGTDASCGLTRAASADLPSPSLPSLFPSFYLLAILLRLP